MNVGLVCCGIRRTVVGREGPVLRGWNSMVFLIYPIGYLQINQLVTTLLGIELETFGLRRATTTHFNARWGTA